MKKTCNGCKAMETGSHKHYCGLDHPVKNNWVPKTGSLLSSTPLEECEKPLSTKKYAEILLFNNARLDFKL